MKTVVVSIGGSVLLSKEADPPFLKQLSALFHSLASEYKLYIVVGGGRIAREYIQLGRSLGFDEHTLDTLGIQITRVNALLLAHLLPDANTKIPETTEQAKTQSSPIVVMGGTTPGHSTDMVAADLAEKTKALRFVNATNVDGIFDKDPNKYADATPYKEIAVDELIQSYGTTWKTAGKNIVIDPPALAIIKRIRLPTSVVNGKRLDQLEKAIRGIPFEGTIITI